MEDLEASKLCPLEVIGMLGFCLEVTAYETPNYQLYSGEHLEHYLVFWHEVQDAPAEVTEDMGLVQEIEKLGVYWVEHQQVLHQRPGQAADEGVDGVDVLGVYLKGDDLILGAEVFFSLLALQEEVKVEALEHEREGVDSDLCIKLLTDSDGICVQGQGVQEEEARQRLNRFVFQEGVDRIIKVGQKDLLRVW